MPTQKTIGLILAVALAACGNSPAEPQPDYGERFTPSGKADAAGLPRLLFAEIDRASFWSPRVKVHAAAPQGAVAVGMAYKVIDGDYGSTDWAAAHGHYSHRADGQAVFAVEVELQHEVGEYGSVRFALFAIRDDGETVWNNNDGDDFYCFGNRYNGALGYYQAEVAAQQVKLTMMVANMGYEEVSVAYDLDGEPGEVTATWAEDLRAADRWEAEIGPVGDARELAFAVRVKNGDSTVVADNFGHRFRIGLVAGSAPTLRFYDGGYEVKGADLEPGGTFQVLYERAPSCRDCYQGMCSSTIDIGYRFYDGPAYWTTTMSRSYYSDGEGPITSAPIYIPRDAQKLELWFRHTGGRPNCEAWDSNNGTNYLFGW